MGTVLALLGAFFLAQGAPPLAPSAPPAAPPTPGAPPTTNEPPAGTLAPSVEPPVPAAPPVPAPPEELAAPPVPAPPEELAAPHVPAPPEELAAPHVPAAPPEPRVYGYAGMSELSLALGYSSVSGFLGGAGFRRFVVDGLAPGLEASVQTGSGTTVGLLLGTLRLAPVRASQLAVVVTGRAGRVFLSHHDDGWGAGGGVGVIWFLSPHAGLELGYDVLWLLPQSFCADLTSCTVQGPEIGLRLSF